MALFTIFPLLIKQPQKRRKNNLGVVPKNSHVFFSEKHLKKRKKEFNIKTLQFVEMEKSKKLVVIIMQDITNLNVLLFGHFPLV